MAFSDFSCIYNYLTNVMYPYQDIIIKYIYDEIYLRILKQNINTTMELIGYPSTISYNLDLNYDEYMNKFKKIINISILLQLDNKIQIIYNKKHCIIDINTFLLWIIYEEICDDLQILLIDCNLYKQLRVYLAYKLNSNNYESNLLLRTGSNNYKWDFNKHIKINY